MMISSSCKKLMAFVMAVALVLSVLFIPSPQKAKAADNRVPSVSFLGATIRILDADIQRQTQAMRIAIRVDNADKADDCAIKLTVNGNTYTVSTKPVGNGVNAQQIKMNYVNTDEHYVEYAIALYNIPRQNFYTPITVTGYAWDMAGNEYNTSADDSINKRNITGIVDALKAKYPLYNIKLGSDGILTKTVDSVASNLTVPDFANYEDSVGEAPTTAAPANILPTLGNDSSDDDVTITKTGEGSISGGTGYDDYTTIDEGNLVINDETDDNMTEVRIPLPSTAYENERVVVELAGTMDNTFNGCRMFLGTAYGEGRSDADEPINKVIGDFRKQYDFIATGEVTHIIIKSNWGEDCNIQGLTISSVGVFYPDRGADIPVVVPPEGINLANTKTNSIAGVTVSNGTVFVEDDRTSGTTEFYIPLNENLKTDEKITVVFEGYFGKDNFEGDNKGFRAFVGTQGNSHSTITGSSNTYYHVSPSKVGYFRQEVNFTAGSDVCSTITIKGGSGADNSIQGLELHAVSVYYIDRDMVVPSAGALPAPRPYSIDLTNSSCIWNNNYCYLGYEYGRLVVEDKSLDSSHKGEFGFALPSAYVNDGYDRITIRYDDGSLTGLNAVQHYGTNRIEWIENETNMGGINFSGSTGSAVISGAEGQSLSATRLYGASISPVGSVKIESVIFWSSEEGGPAGDYWPAVVPAQATPAPTAAPSADVYAAKVPSGQSITIDGTGNEAAWDAAYEYPFKYYSGNRAKGSNVASIKLLWDSCKVYALVDVIDPDLFAGTDGGDSYRRDGIEIFFDEDNSKEYSSDYRESAYSSNNTDAFQYRFSGIKDSNGNAYSSYEAKGDLVSDRYGNVFKTSSSGDTVDKNFLIKRTLKANNNGYTVEFAIPLYRLASLNQVVGFDVSILDCHTTDTNSQSRDNEMWFTGSSEKGNMWYNTRPFANLKLVNSVSTTSPTVGTDGHTLAHFTFEDSTLSNGVYTSVDGANSKARVNGSLSNDASTWFGSKAMNFAENSYSFLDVEKADGSGLFDNYSGDEMTIAYWGKVTNSTISQSGLFSFSAQDEGKTLNSNNRQYVSVKDTYSEIRFDRASSTSNSSYNTLTLPSEKPKHSATWNHVVYVIDGTTMRMYLNGELVATSTLSDNKALSSLFAGSTDVFIGMRPWCNNGSFDYFCGAIDEFIVKDVAMSDADVTALYNSYSDSVPSPTPVPTDTPEPLAPETYSNIVASNDAPVAMRVPYEIELDGQIDAIWGDLPYYNFGDGSLAKAKIAWDDNYLYALVRVDDNEIRTPGDSSTPYKWDGGEIFLDEDNCGASSSYNKYVGSSDPNKDAFQYRLTGFGINGKSCNQIANNEPAKSRYPNSNMGAFNIINSDGSGGCDGYILEYKIPWYDSSSVKIGKVIGFALNVLNCTGDGNNASNNELCFLGSGSCYNNANNFGRLTLVAGPDAYEDVYDVDITGNVNENGEDGVTRTNNQDGSITFEITNGRGIKFTDVPTDPDYKYVQIVYTKSGGSVNAYPDSSNNDLLLEGIPDSSNYKTVILPALSGASPGVKLFVFNSATTITIKSVKFYKE